MFFNTPIPNQCITSKTLSKDKNLRSIIFKICIQVCAKLPKGIPWEFDNLPIMRKFDKDPKKRQLIPTSIIGIDIYHHPKSISVMALIATLNVNASRY